MKEKKLEKFSSFDKDPVIRTSFIVASLGWLATTLGIGWFYNQLPPILPLFYSIARGEQQLAQKQFITLLPVLSLVFLITHIVFAWTSYTQDMVFARIMTISATLMVFMFAVAGIHILWIVI